MSENIDKERKAFLIKHLRRISLYWPPRNNAKRQARVARGLYKCVKCQRLFKAKQIQMDHINPIVSPEEGFKNFNQYAESLFCEIRDYQPLCKECHEIKTEKENKIRKKNKKK